MMILFSSLAPQILFDFTKNSDLKNWIIVDDGVMGGKSAGTFKLSPEGHGVFEGTISLENYGGFSSVRYTSTRIFIKESTRIKLKLKGDGKKYQFRIKSNAGDYYSYISTFSTSGEWEEIEILLKDMYPSYRGRRLDQANFSNDYIEEIAFLIGNKRPENFKLLIDKIELK
jgi:hypothetical protein